MPAPPLGSLPAMVRATGKGMASAYQALSGRPAATQRAVNLHYALSLRQTQLRQRQLTREQVSLRVQHLEVAIQAAAITQFGEPDGILQRIHQVFLLDAFLPQAVERAERVG